MVKLGLLSKLKEIFSRKSLESFKEIEAEFEKLKKKSSSEIIALIGISGKPKGLPLVYIADDEKMLKQYAARVTELVNPLKNISNEKKIKDVVICYEDSALLLNPIMDDISFFAKIKNRNDISILRQWINNKSQELIDVFHS